MYERLRVNVIVYRGSTFKVTRDLFTYIASVIFTYSYFRSTPKRRQELERSPALYPSVVC